MSNDHDGCGQELLAQNLDIVHIDPYPSLGSKYLNNIPRDMSYVAGLARRYRKPLIPWMQAHKLSGDLPFPSSFHIDQMLSQQWAQGIDGVLWLGYGKTRAFPNGNRAGWDEVAEFHDKLARHPPQKPTARLAVLRSYSVFALTSRCEDKIRNPGDWMLQQLLEIWAVKHGQAYDVFELAPNLSEAELGQLVKKLGSYDYIVSNFYLDGAWVVGDNMEGKVAQPSDAGDLQRQYEHELFTRAWLVA